MSMHPTALVADDEPLLRSSLIRQLAAAWPALRVVAEARHGIEAVEQFEQHTPDLCFLDVHMPGMSGVEAARQIGSRAQLVFVTAYQHYAVQAFEQGALDYLVKPVEPARLAQTVARLQERLRAAAPPREAALQALIARLDPAAASPRLRWIRASAGKVLRLIPVDAVDYLRASDKYTHVAWRDTDRRPAEAVVRQPIKDLLAQLDPEQFVQVHRSLVVNLSAIDHVRRLDDGAEIHLRGRSETLPVSRSYLPYFRQM